MNIIMNIIQLYPQHKKYTRLHGIYLDDKSLRASNNPLVYANFLSSLDGRIALVQEQQSYLPEKLTSLHDHRLLLELHAHADCIITHGGYLRSLEAKRLGNILQIEQTPTNADLISWRHRHGLAAQPLVVVCSNSLQFKIPDSLSPKDVWIATSRAGNTANAAAWRKQGYKVIEAGEQRVDSGELIAQIKTAGYRRIYLCAGPEIFESSLASRCLDLFYLTLSLQLIGHAEFVTMLQGGFTLDRCHLQLKRLILDQSIKTAASQLYMTFSCHYR